MIRRALLLMTMALAALALAVTPALAGEDPPDPTPPAAQPQPAPTPTPTPTPTVPVLTGSARLHTSQGCLTGSAKASVSGSRIESVTFFVDGKKVKTVTTPNAGATYALSMSCARLTFGTHRARAAVTFKTGVSPQRRTLVFQVTRTRPVRPQFAG
jgi:hypothetical protein